MKYQYIGQVSTMTRITKTGEKVKVVYGEIIESDMPESYFTHNGFQKLKVEAKEEPKKVLSKKK